MDTAKFQHYLSTGEYVPAEDMSLAEHDKRWHPQGYKKGDKCLFRSQMAKGDESDAAIGNGETGGISGIFTGSSADYSKPSVMHIGTGEGSQVYGWGLYGSSERGVAEGYADREAVGPRALARNILNALFGNREAAFSYIQTGLKKGAFENEADIKKAAEIIKSGAAIPEKLGNVYEQTFFSNRTSGDDSHLLNWYKPVSKEQRRWIAERLEQEGIDYEGRSVEKSLEKQETNGARMYTHLDALLGSPKSASEFLYRAGIDGIKYPVDSFGGKTIKDGNKAGWNYVAFSDDHIRVDRKWRDGEEVDDEAKGKIERYLALDAAPSRGGEPPRSPTSLAAHDKRFHPHGFDPEKDRCEFREKQKKDDKADSSVLGSADGNKKPWEREYAEVVAKYKGTDKWLKAPNGESTNLTERQWVQVRTPSFKAWFGDWEKDPANASKVVDYNGEPMVVWRGEQGNRNNVKKRNTFYTDQEYNARTGYGDEEGASVDAYFLNLRRPFMPIQKGTYDAWDTAKLKTFLTALTQYKKKNGRSGRDFVNDMLHDQYLSSRKTDDLIRSKNWWNQSESAFKQDWEDVAAVIKKLGHDGLVGVQMHALEFMVPNPNSIKSATDNSGAFSPEKENIMDGAADAPRKPSLRDIAAAAIAEDEDLEAHDRRFHGGQFDPDTQTCGLREGMAKSDDADILAKAVTFEDNDDNFSLLSGGVKIGGCNYTFGWPEDIEEEYSDSVEDFNSSALMSRLGFGGKVMNIEDVWVDEKFRNKGHSADILQHAIELAGRKGATGIVLRAHSDAGISTEVLEKIYSRHGFETVQQTDEDGTIMYRKMDENT